MESKESLITMPVETWTRIQQAFRSDLPRGVSGYAVLETQRDLMRQGLGYGFKVFCPFGEPWNGMVAINEKDSFYEIIIQCPQDDTRNLEMALKATKVIDWNRKVIVPFAPAHILECIKRIVNSINMIIELILPSDSFILNRDVPEIISPPSSLIFGLLKLDHAGFVDTKWEHRYPGSVGYFQLLIKAKLGYGLFLNDALVSWVFINEAGTLGHMYTVEEHRKKGYAQILLRFVCKIISENKKYVFAFCVKGNLPACNLYKKLGFDSYNGGVDWCYLTPGNQQETNKTCQ